MLNTNFSLNRRNNIIFTGRQEIANNLTKAMDAAMIAANKENKKIDNTKELNLMNEHLETAVKDKDYGNCMEEQDELLRTTVKYGEGRTSYYGPLQNFINIQSRYIGNPLTRNSFMPKVGGFALFGDALIKKDIEAQPQTRTIQARCYDFIDGMNVKLRFIEAAEIRSALLDKKV